VLRRIRIHIFNNRATLLGIKQIGEAGFSSHICDNGTPLLDIKPYVPEFDRHEPVKTGWLQDRIGTLPGKRGDTRFG